MRQQFLHSIAMKKQFLLFIFSLLACAMGATANTWSADNLPQPRLYDADNFVANPDGILSPATVRRLNGMLDDINRTTNAQVAVAVIDSYDGEDIDSFATDLFNEWGVGEKEADNGVLLVVAVGPRQYAFRTGRGVGSVVTDVETARIARNVLIPNFREGNYEQGLTGAVESLHRIMTTPEAVNEIREMSARVKDDNEQTVWEIVMLYVWCAIALTLCLAVWAFWNVRKTKGMERHLRHVKLHPMARILYGVSWIGLGIPFFVYIPFNQFLKNLRDGEHLCPNCKTRMHKLDEIHDNEHLTPAQDAEERFNSVDYDVWECPNCGEEDIYAFENQDSGLVECPQCHAKTARYVRDRVVKMPTATSEGLAVKEFDCLNCHKRSQKPFRLPKQPNVAGAAAAASIPFILGGMGRGGGGGFGGGSFGGGVTGGGGSSGSW